MFTAFAGTLPAKVCPIFVKKDESPNFSPYLDRRELLDMLEQYTTEIVQDGLLGVGLLYHDEEVLLECFVHFAKYLQFWGRDKKPFEGVMQRFGIQPVKGLQFIDEFPMVTEISGPDDLIA